MKKWIVWAISFQLAFGNQLAIAQESKAPRPPTATVTTPLSPQGATESLDPTTLLLNLMASAGRFQTMVNDPLFQELIKTPRMPMEIPAHLIDQNPFWMHGQKWIVSGSPLEVSTTDVNGYTEIHLGSVRKAVVLPEKFRIHGLIDDFVMMTRTRESEDGLWFFSLTEAQHRAPLDAPVPIHFLPVPKTTLPLAGLAFDRSADWMIVEPLDGEGFTVDLSMIRLVRDWQSGILTMALSRCIQDSNCRAQEGDLSFAPQVATGQILRLLPPVGTVAAHGFIPKIENPTQGSRPTSKWQHIANLFFPQAHALSIDPNLYHQATWIAVVIGSLIAMSVVANMTVLKEKMARIRVLKEIDRHYKKSMDRRDRLWGSGLQVEAERRAFEREVEIIRTLNEFKKSWKIMNATKSPAERDAALQQIVATFENFQQNELGEVPTIRTFWGKRKTAFLNTFDIFAHMITAVAQFGGVTLGNLVEYSTDRFLPDFAASENAFLRKWILDKTFFFSRSVFEQNAVSGAIFVRGALWSGTLLTFFTAIEYIWMAPAVAGWASTRLPPEMKAAVLVAFNPNNPQAAQVMINDTFRTGLASLQTGTSEFSAESRAIELPIARKAAIAEVRAMGKDPFALENELMVRKIAEDKINRALVQLGLPDSSEFIFDIHSIYRGVAKEVGYGAIATEYADQATLLARPGLSLPTLNRAIQLAERMLHLHPDPENRQALQVFRNLKADFGFVSALRQASFRDRGKLASAAARMYRARKFLAVLSLEGGIAQALREVPDFLQGYSPESIRRANFMFRFALATHLKGAERYQLNADYTVTEKPQFIEKQRQREEFKTDWFARWQLSLAEQAGLRATQTQSLHAGTVDFERVYTEAFRTELARTVRLTYSEGDHVEFAKKKAEEATEIARGTPEFQAYRNVDLNYEATKLLARIHSLEFLRAYREATMENQMIPPLHPDQPGALQPLRRLAFVNNSRFLTSLVRIAEGSFDDNRFVELGFGSFIDRTLPAWYDIRTGFIRSMKFLPGAVTAGYIMTTQFWQVNLSWSTMVVMAAAASLILTPKQYLNRVFRHIGKKPMYTLRSRTMYTIPYALMSFAGIFPILMLNGPAQTWVPIIGTAVAQAGGVSLIGLLAWQSWIHFRQSTPALEIGPRSQLKDVSKDPGLVSKDPADSQNQLDSMNRPAPVSCNDVHLLPL